MSHDPNDPYGSPPGGAPQDSPTPGASDGSQGGQSGFGQPQGGQGRPQGGFGQPQAAPHQGSYGGPPPVLGASPPYGGPGYGAYGQPPGPGGAQPTAGWKIAAIVLLIIGPVFTAIGLIPCLGILNWLAIPTNVALAVVGTLGLTIGPKEADGRPVNFPLHLAAIIVGALLAIASVVRCTMGSGLV